nr:MerR family DNA-binding transcriptional regulator [Pseudonocardia sp. C8]
MIRTAEAAKALGVDPATLSRWAKAGIVKPATRTAGGQARWDLDDLRRQLDERNAQAEE